MNEVEKISLRIINDTKYRWECYLSLCESPIEKLFAANFINHYISPPNGYSMHSMEFIIEPCNDQDFYSGDMWETIRPHVKSYYPGLYCSGIRLLSNQVGHNDVVNTNIAILPQFNIMTAANKYRVDFLLRNSCPFEFDNAPIYPEIIIECDGHDFHQKTKQQVERDNKRHRDLISNGYIILRYSGSEIYFNKNFKEFVTIIREIENTVFQKERLRKEKIKKEFVNRMLASGFEKWQIV